jgi:hypothetical protein
MSRKNELVSLGVKRIAALRALEGEEREFAAVELEQWEGLLVQLSRAQPDDETAAPTTEPPRMIESEKTEILPQ